MSTTQPVNLDLPGGFLKTVSPVAAKGRVIDGQWVRFQNGKWEKIAGFIKAVAAQVNGIVRGMFGWTTAANQDLVALGTATKLYSMSDQLADITPIAFTGTLGTNPFTMTSGQPTVTVHDTAHGVIAGTIVNFSGATAAQGLTINGSYPVTSVTDADNYVITASGNATGNGSGGGSSVVYTYYLNPGLQDQTYGIGYGSGLYGRGTYGTPRSPTNGLSNDGGITNELRTWFFANYGNELAVLPSGGTVYLWNQNNGDPLPLPVSNAPAMARAMFITPERMIVLLGTTLPMTMAWCDRLDPTNWTPSLASTANVRTLQGGNKLIAGATFFGGVNLIWSDTTCFLMQFIGTSGEIYSTLPIGEGCGLIGPCAYGRSPDTMVWMSDYRFYIYSGGIVLVAPRQDEIRAYILGEVTRNGVVTGGRLDRTKATKIACGHNPKHNGFWWHYTSIDSPDGENDEYVIVCLDDWSWYTGKLNRSAMTHAESPLGTTYMAGTDSYIYQHEVGNDADGSPLPWFMQTGPVPLGNAQTDMDVIGFVPDWERQTQNITLEIRTKDRPASSTYIDDATFVMPEGTELVDMKLGGRYADLKFSGSDLGSDFRIGIPQLEVGVGGDRR